MKYVEFSVDALKVSKIAKSRRADCSLQLVFESMGSGLLGIKSGPYAH